MSGRQARGLGLALLLLTGCAARDAWIRDLPDHTCPRNAAAEAGLTRPRRGLEADLSTSPLAALDRACPDLPGGQPDSLGSATEGVLCGAERLEDDPSQPWVLMDATRARATMYGSGALLQLLRRAAADVAGRHPGLRLPIGNVARGGGGDLPWSVSHNSGRDADLFFYVRDEAGQQIVPERVAVVGPDLTFADGGRAGRLDVDANLDLVLALGREAGRDLQWIFVSRPIRAALLERARQRREPRALVARLGALLHQPRGTLPHDDHLHVRLGCRAAEAALGCVDLPPARAGGRVGPPDAGSALVRHLTGEVRKGPRRGDALSALWTLGVRDVGAAILPAWPRLDEPGRVLLLALATREGRLPGRARRTLDEHLRAESSPRVRRYALDHWTRRLPQADAARELVAAARAGRVHAGPTPFETFDEGCLVLDLAREAGTVALLLDLAEGSLPCPTDAEGLDRAARGLTGWPLADLLRQAPRVARQPLKEVRIQALRARGYLTRAEPTRVDLLAAAGAIEPDVADVACRLLTARLSLPASVCRWERSDRLAYLARKVGGR